jgi:hypothetical protein
MNITVIIFFKGKCGAALSLVSLLSHSFIYFIFPKSNTGNNLGCGIVISLNTIVVKIQQSHNCVALRTNPR